MYCAKLTWGFSGLDAHTAVSKAFLTLEASTPHDFRYAVYSSLRILGAHDPPVGGVSVGSAFLLPSEKKKTDRRD